MIGVFVWRLGRDAGQLGWELGEGRVASDRPLTDVRGSGRALRRGVEVRCRIERNYFFFEMSGLGGGVAMRGFGAD